MSKLKSESKLLIATYILAVFLFELFIILFYMKDAFQVFVFVFAFTSVAAQLGLLELYIELKGEKK